MLVYPASIAITRSKCNRVMCVLCVASSVQVAAFSSLSLAAVGPCCPCPDIISNAALHGTKCLVSKIGRVLRPGEPPRRGSCTVVIKPTWFDSDVSSSGLEMCWYAALRYSVFHLHTSI